MKRLLATLLLFSPLFAISDAPAQGESIEDQLSTMEIHNTSSKVANVMGIFAIDEDGNPIDDNLGSTDFLQPGESETITMTTWVCGPVDIDVRMGETEEITGRFDTCKTHEVNRHD